MSNNLILVSICCITYNHEKYIREAIEGFLMQKTNFDYEIIIANDCSPDNTDAIVQEYIHHHPKGKLIKYFKHEQNLGMMPNFIFALKQCTGKYIALCEGDDYWTDPLKLQKQVDFMEANKEYSGCFHNANVVDSNGKQIRVFHSEVLKSSYDFEAMIQGLFVPTASLMFRNDKGIVESIKSLVQGLSSGDRLLLALIASKGLIGYLDQNMCAYRKHVGGISSWGPRLTIFKSNVILFKKLQKHFYPRYNKVLTNQIFRWQGYLSNEYWKNRSFFNFAVQILKTALYIRNINDLKAFFKVYLFHKKP